MPRVWTDEWKSSLRLGGLIFCGKLLWLALRGVLYEADSAAYLSPDFGLLHPPGYPVFARALASVPGSLHTVVIVQSLLFALVWGWLIRLRFSTPSGAWIAAFILALEPCTSQLCISLMSETLFLSCAGMALILFHYARTTGNPNLLFLLSGAMTGCAFTFRYPALWLLCMLGIAILFPSPFSRKVWLNLVLLFIGFQLVIFPLRIHNYEKLSIFRAEVFSSASRWNTTAFLLPEASDDGTIAEFASSLGINPKDSSFTADRTWHTAHIFDTAGVFFSWMHSPRPDPGFLPALDALTQKLIMGSTADWIRFFLVPNYLRAFTFQEHTVREEADSFFREHYHYVAAHDPLYSPVQGVIIMTLSLALGLFAATTRHRTGIAFFLGLMGCFFVTGCVAVMFVRFLFVFVPFLVIAWGRSESF